MSLTNDIIASNDWVRVRAKAHQIEGMVFVGGCGKSIYPPGEITPDTTVEFLMERALAEQSGFEIISEPKQGNAMKLTREETKELAEEVREIFPDVELSEAMQKVEAHKFCQNFPGSHGFRAGLITANAIHLQKSGTLRNRRLGPLAPAAFGIHVKMMLLDHFGDHFAFPTFPPTLEQDILDHFEKSFNAFTTAQRLIEKYTPKIACEMRDHIPEPGVYVPYGFNSEGDWIMDRPMFYPEKRDAAPNVKYFGPLPNPKFGHKI